MDEPAHGRYAAIYAIPAKRVPKSFYFAAGVAALVHAALGWYLIHQAFATPEAQPIPEGPVILVDNYKIEKPVVIPEKPKPATNPPPIHDAQPKDSVQDTIDAQPQPPGDQPKVVVDLPKVVTPPQPVVTDTSVKPSVITARWARFPDADALASYYPQKAAEDEIEGSATVQCTILDTAGRVACVAVTESPPRYGFGAATVRMVQDKGRVDTSQGNAPVGSILRQTVTWRLN